MDKGFDLNICTFANFRYFFHCYLASQNNAGQAQLFPKLKGFVVGRRSLGRQVNFKTRCLCCTDHDEGGIRYNDSIQAHIPQFTEPSSCTCFISFMSYHVGSHINLSSTSVGIFNPFPHLFHTKVPSAAPQTIGLTADENSISTIIDGYLQFFQSPSR